MKSSDSSGKIHDRSIENENKGEENGSYYDNEKKYRVPFIYMLPTNHNNHKMNGDDVKEDLEVILSRGLAQYKENIMDKTLRQLQRSMELALRMEWILNRDGQYNNYSSLSKDWEHRIQQTAIIIEQEYGTLSKLLQLTLTPSPSIWTFALPDPKHHTAETSNNHIKNATYSIPTVDSEQQETSNSAYESIGQIVTHLVRDWSELGNDIRHDLYGWIISQLESLPTSDNNDDNSLSILIPGAGLGRLAYDVSAAFPQHQVEANELSLSMATVSHSIFNYYLSNDDNIRQNTFTTFRANNSSFQMNDNDSILRVHPFAFDFLINEVDTKYRFQSVRVPDVSMKENPTNSTNNNLSFTIGDFVNIYSQPNQRGTKNVVITCFFVDTATNVYEYILTIQNVLSNSQKNSTDRGVWIHVGPLQWHGSSQLAPSVNEFRQLLLKMNFKILHWSIDEIPIPYRPAYPSTKFEGYTPLRFVLQYNNNHTSSTQEDNNHNAAHTIAQMRYLSTNLSTTTY